MGMCISSVYHIQEMHCNTRVLLSAILLSVIITQAGDSALMIAARWGKTNQVLVELVKAGGDLNLQNRVYIHVSTLN